MQLYAQQLHAMLRRDILHCRKKELDEKMEIECCFQIASKYWALLSAKARECGFKNTGYEIDFYKKWKPLFLSTIEYYGLCYHALIVIEGCEKKDVLEKFYEREIGRLQRFINGNRDFYDYYQSGKTDQDEEWMLPNTEEPNYTKDHLISTLLALQQYDAYIRQQIPSHPITTSN